MKPKARVIISLVILAGIGLTLLLQRSAPSAGNSIDSAAHGLALIDCADRGYDVDQPNPIIVPEKKAFSYLCSKVAPADPEGVASVVNSVREDLARRGINETNLDVCLHLAGSCPDNFRPDIASIAAGYVALREGSGG